MAQINHTAEQMLQDAVDFTARLNEDSEYNSCIVIVMTYGDPGKFIGVDGNYVGHDHFFRKIIENKALAGKPKIFIIQACRGSKFWQNIS